MRRTRQPRANARRVAAPSAFIRNAINNDGLLHQVMLLAMRPVRGRRDAKRMPGTRPHIFLANGIIRLDLPTVARCRLNRL